MKQSIIYLSFFFILIFFSCSDSEKENSPIVGSWNLISYEIKTENPPTEWRPLGESCRLDDIEEYNEDGTWTRYDGTNQCGGGNCIGIYNGTWKFVANNSKVIFTYQGVPGEYESTVETLNGNTLVLSFSSGTTDGRQNRVTYSKN